MWKILVSWSVAYDFIMDFTDKFENHIKPDSIHKLSVSFVVDKLKKEKWWTWLNISYNIALLWKKPLLLSGVWNDYDFWDFIKNNVNLENIYISKEYFSSSCYITNDNSWSQITAFYPWAMLDSDKTSVNDLEEDISYVMVSPNKKETMLKHLQESKKLWIKNFFDPGQAIFSMNREDLLVASENADYLIVNDYEFDLFKDISWLEKLEIISKFEKVIITLWQKWSVIIDKSWELFIPVVENANVIDPTWAWDAYRWWMLVWLNSWYDFETSWKMWSLLASINVWSFWWQNHFISKDDFEKLFLEEFWINIKL